MNPMHGEWFPIFDLGSDLGDRTFFSLCRRCSRLTAARNFKKNYSSYVRRWTYPTKASSSPVQQLPAVIPEYEPDVVAVPPSMKVATTFTT